LLCGLCSMCIKLGVPAMLNNYQPSYTYLSLYDD
jgi:hypothetical protein